MILDWLLFCTIRPRFVVLPGTEGMAGYRDDLFEFIGLLRGPRFCAAGELVISSAWMGIQLLA